MSSALKIAPLALLLGLAGCGFHPLYGPQAGGSPEIQSRMDEIDIGLLANRQGQIMHEALERDLQRDGTPTFYRYHLTVRFDIAQQTLGIQEDTSSTRNRFIGTAHWELTPEGNRGLTIAKGDAQAMDAENIIDNQYFASSLGTGVMRHHLARELARQITTQLAIWLRAHPDRTP